MYPADNSTSFWVPPGGPLEHLPWNAGYDSVSIDMGVSMAMGDPQNGWFIRENSFKKDDDWGYPYSWSPPYL